MEAMQRIAKIIMNFAAVICLWKLTKCSQNTVVPRHSSEMISKDQL